jgi:hypothetical protein
MIDGNKGIPKGITLVSASGTKGEVNCLGMKEQ